MCVCGLCIWMQVPTEARNIATEQIHLLGIELMPSARGTHALKLQAISPVTSVWIWNLSLFEDDFTAFLINNERFSLILYIRIFEKDSSLFLTMLYDINIRNVMCESCQHWDTCDFAPSILGKPVLLIKCCNIPGYSVFRQFLMASQNFFLSNYFSGIKGLITTKEHVAHFSHCLGAATPTLKALTLFCEPGLMNEIT